MTLVEAVAAQRQEEQIRDLHDAPRLRGRPALGSPAAGHETSCAICGLRTRDKTGTCISCRRPAAINVGKYSTEQVVSLMERCRAELKSRQERIATALQETP